MHDVIMSVAACAESSRGEQANNLMATYRTYTEDSDNFGKIKCLTVIDIRAESYTADIGCNNNVVLCCI